VELTTISAKVEGVLRAVEVDDEVEEEVVVCVVAAEVEVPSCCADALKMDAAAPAALTVSRIRGRNTTIDA
jgi:hypothetical protein